MKNITLLAVIFLGALVVIMTHAGPTYAQQTTLAVANPAAAVDSVIGSPSSVPVQLVRGGGHGGHGRVFHGGFRRGFVGGGIYLPYAYGGDYGGCGEGCYQEGDKTCVWNGYNYRCYTTGPSY